MYYIYHYLLMTYKDKRQELKIGKRIIFCVFLSLFLYEFFYVLFNDNIQNIKFRLPLLLDFI